MRVRSCRTCGPKSSAARPRSCGQVGEPAPFAGTAIAFRALVLTSFLSALTLWLAVATQMLQTAVPVRPLVDVWKCNLFFRTCFQTNEAMRNALLLLSPSSVSPSARHSERSRRSTTLDAMSITFRVEVHLYGVFTRANRKSLLFLTPLPVLFTPAP